MEKVYLVGPIDSIGKATLHQKLTPQFIVEEIAEEAAYHKLTDANYIVLRTLKIGQQAIALAPNLKLIQRWGVGFDSVDIKAAGENGVQVAITTGINSVPVSEYAVMLMLAVYRNLIPTHQSVASKGWRNEDLIQRSYTIHGKCVGLIGLGNIGRLVAAKVRAFGAMVCYFDLFRLDADTEKSLGLTYLSLDELLATSDIISLHLPCTDATRNMIDAGKLAMMKQSAILVNTARGGVVDEEALYDALKNNRLLGAGLDVFAQEPPVDNPLIELPNVVLSAHSAGNTADNSVLMAMRCAENIIKVSQGNLLSKPDLVNQNELKNKARPQ